MEPPRTDSWKFHLRGQTRFFQVYANGTKIGPLRSLEVSSMKMRENIAFRKLVKIAHFPLRHSLISLCKIGRQNSSEICTLNFCSISYYFTTAQISGDQKRKSGFSFRGGPYICGERSGGGLPFWLYANDPEIKLRSSDATYLKYVGLWWDHLLPKLRPYLYENGGPIIMFQLENEYGSYGMQTGFCDVKYMIFLRVNITWRH
jgi:hypothetical protein